MIGGLSSSLSTALRTAGSARKTMDTMARQIATGQRVASVKDDGATWTRANAMRSQQSQIEGRRNIASVIGLTVENHATVIDASIKAVEGLRDQIIAARTYQPGTSARAALAAEYTNFIAMGDGIGFQPEGIIDDGSGGLLNVAGTASDPLLSGTMFHTWHGRGVGAVGWLNVLRTGNLNTANTATLDTLQTEAEFRLTALRERAVWSARGSQYLDWVQSASTGESDRLDTAIGSLTDADLGKASTARAQADTRQQLALQTIQQALNAYGNYAGSLLGNVQRTQQGVRA